MMAKTRLCDICHKPFPIPRHAGNKLYCSEPCKERAKYLKSKGWRSRQAPNVLTPPRIDEQVAARDECRVLASEATTARPGSTEKIAAIASRALAGQELWHPLDAGYCE